MVDRIASFTNTSQLIQNNMRIQKQYAEGQVQASTGLKADTYQGISSDATKILNLESDYSRIVAQTENAQTALDRTQIMFDSLGSILSLAQSFQSDLSAAISGTATEDEIQNIAQTNLESTASALNTQVAGRYVFSGSATNTAPVDIEDVGYGGATIPSTVNTSYYQGNDYTMSVEAADGFNISYGITADEAGIEEIMRAYDLVRTTPGDPDTLQEALSLLQSGLDALAVSRAQVSQSSQAIDNKINDNVDDLNLIDNMITDLKAVDLAEVTVKLQEFEAQLEASYSVTADLLRLNLSDYI